MAVAVTVAFWVTEELPSVEALFNAPVEKGNSQTSFCAAAPLLQLICAMATEVVRAVRRSNCKE
jgi:hypothetical protein